MKRFIISGVVIILFVTIQLNNLEKPTEINITCSDGSKVLIDKYTSKACGRSISFNPDRQKLIIYPNNPYIEEEIEKAFWEELNTTKERFYNGS